MGKYFAIVNENQWEVDITEFYDCISCKLVDKKTGDEYFFGGIKSLKQVADNEFVIIERIFDSRPREYTFTRYVLRNQLETQKFYHISDNLYWLNDDKILCEHWNEGFHFSGIYSVKCNRMLKKAEWLEGMAVSIYKNEATGEVKLYVEKELLSDLLGSQKIMFTVNPDTLEPDSVCYSQLRNSYIKVKNHRDIIKIISEEKKYINIIEKHMIKTDEELCQKAKEKILDLKKSK